MLWVSKGASFTILEKGCDRCNLVDPLCLECRYKERNV